MRKIVDFWVKSGVFEGSALIGECEGTVRRESVLNHIRGVKDAGGNWSSGRDIRRILRRRS